MRLGRLYAVSFVLILVGVFFFPLTPPLSIAAIMAGSALLIIYGRGYMRCPNCKYTVSQKAAFCPRCSYNFSQGDTTKTE
ncbi:MAG: hypothetical protein ACE5KO_06880 [Candidatus Bathyarchaeia archaeon]